MELPNELIDEILTRVPVKDVLRCRCVSKDWCSVIDSAEFEEKYLKVSVERSRCGVLIQGSGLDNLGGKYLLADLESLEDGTAAIDISEEVGGIVNGARVIGSANGLVCLCILGGTRDSLLLLNPCTRKCKKLPAAGTEFLENNDLSEYTQFGFGYDHVGNDYKVVLVACHKTPNTSVMAIVYSLKNDSWTPIQDAFSTEKIRFSDTLGTLADGVVLWRAFDVISKNSVVVGLDLHLQQFIEAQCSVRSVHLVGISIENSLAEEIVLHPLLRNSSSIRLLLYSKNLEKILVEVDCKKYMWYHFRSRTLKNISVPGIPNRFFSHRYIESLFPLIEDVQPKKQQPMRRLLTMVLVLCSVVGSLMIFTRSRKR